MAKYNREFLVPYLHDVCALHLADFELCGKMFKTQRQILQLNHGEELEPPEEPELEDAWNIITVPCAVIGGFELFGGGAITLGAIFRQIEPGFVFLGLISVAIGLVIWKYLVSPAIYMSKVNEALIEQYQKDLVQYKIDLKQVERENDEARKRIPELERRLEAYSNERKKIGTVLKRVYSANVLPSQFRDMYSAVYLYDYFSNSRADDLDQVLNTFVLEQIKDKLDDIIENQRISILNQRLIIQNQRQAMEEQRIHNEYMRKKVCQISASIEEQNQYLAMIEANSAANAYFAAAHYLK